MINVRRLRNIRYALTIDTAKILSSALILPHLDYANAILYGLPKKTLNMIQRIQNITAKLVLQKKKSDSATQCLKTLHWLPIRLRIKYKIILLVFKCMHGLAPEYLCSLLKPRLFGNHDLRTTMNDGVDLEIPRTKEKIWLIDLSGLLVQHYGIPYQLK